MELEDVDTAAVAAAAAAEEEAEAAVVALAATPEVAVTVWLVPPDMSAGPGMV